MDPDTNRCIDAASIPAGKGPNPQGVIVPCQDQACVSCRANFARCDACDAKLTPKRYLWDGRCITLDQAPAGVGLAKDEDKLVECKIAGCRGDKPAPVDGGELPDTVEPPKPLSNDLRKVTSTILKFSFDFTVYQLANQQEFKQTWTAPISHQSIANQVVNSLFRTADFDQRVQALANKNIRVQDESLHTISEYVRVEQTNVKTVLYYYLSTRFRNTLDLKTASAFYDEVKGCKPWIVREFPVDPYVDAAEKYILGRVQFLIINCVPKKGISLFLHTATGRAQFTGQAPAPRDEISFIAAGVIRELLMREAAAYFA